MTVEVVEFGGTKYAEILWASTTVAKTTFFSPPSSSFQFGLLAHEAGFVEPPHYHKAVQRDHRRPAADVRRAARHSGASSFFTDDGTLLAEVVLNAGDAIVLIHGVHAIRVLEDMQCISVKQGPFLGAENDKINVRWQR